MSGAGEGRAPRRSTPTTGSPARGIVLIVVAVVAGFLLIGMGLDSDGSGPVAAPSGTTSTTAQETTTTTVAVRPVNEVKVLVANGSGVDGAAGRITDQLNAAGYATGSPTNSERVEATVVYYTEGFDREAVVVAETIGATSAQVQALGPPPAPVDDTQGSNVLVIVGPDIASG